jgi:PAS domain S-box-containing protein
MRFGIPGMSAEFDRLETGRAPSSRGLIADALIGLSLSAAYILLARIGLSFHAVSTFAALVWPPSGISVAALLLLGVRFWPAITLGAFLANFWAGAPVPVALAVAAGNTGEALFAAWALRRIPGFRVRLDRLRDVVGFVVLAGICGPGLGATVGVSSFSVAGLVPPAAWVATWRAWFLGDSIAILILTPLILTRTAPAPAGRPRTLVEKVALTLMVCGASYFLFGVARNGTTAVLAPVLIWAALRFEVRGAAFATMLVAAIAIWATARGHGPFASAVVEDGLARLQSFMLLTSATFLVLGATMLERRRADTARRHAEATTEESESRYRQIADGVEQLLWITDAEGNVTFLNRQWEKTIAPLEAGRGMRWAEVLHPDDREEMLAQRKAAIAAGRPYRSEVRVRMRNGEYRWMLSRVVPVRNAQGRITSWFGAAADVHALKTGQEELRFAKEAAEEAGRAKDRFLATLSHELRTPLTPVLAYSSILERDASLDRETRRRAEVVRRNAELEARLIDDLLDLTRVTSGKLEMHKETVGLYEAIDHAMEICREDADRGGVSIARVATKGEAFVHADPARLRQIFWNILKNAVKFTPRGGKVLVRTASAEEGFVAVEISDTGSGIEESELHRIFQPFEQAGHGKGGLGLGLAISRGLVEAQGGTLTARSAGAGEGSTFRIEFPSVVPQRESAHPTGTSPASGHRAVRRVLLVEDHVDSAAAVKELLGVLSCDVVVAHTVQAALDASRTGPFDLVLSDLGLPDGNGLDLMRTLRDQHGFSGIAITGHGMADDLRNTRDAGFVGHLVKPITLQRLSDAVQEFFQEREAAATRR